MLYRDRETSLANANNTIKTQKVKAEIALNELKKEIESKSMKLYEDMKEQMNKCERDLEKSRSLREKQARDFTKQIEEFKHKHQEEVNKQI